MSDTAPVLPEPPALTASASTLARGTALFDRYCAPCHGSGAFGGGVIPDLRYARALGDAGIWRRIVIDGALQNQGMVSFSQELSADDAEATRAYVIQRATLAYRHRPPQ